MAPCPSQGGVVYPTTIDGEEKLLVRQPPMAVCDLQENERTLQGKKARQLHRRKNQTRVLHLESVGG